MTLVEAIENLKEEAEFEQWHGNLTMVDSIKLLIEAGKRLIWARGQLIWRDDMLLPGETKD